MVRALLFNSEKRAISPRGRKRMMGLKTSIIKFERVATSGVYQVVFVLVPLLVRSMNKVYLTAEFCEARFTNVAATFKSQGFGESAI
jgi:hypothetical protein